eukprot:gene3742-4661_t
MTLKDKRSNRRRVSCGFHHKRHQACPETCEGRVSHPPTPHQPVQDKFTVGCTECKTFFQNKLLNQTLGPLPQQQQPTIIATTSSAPNSATTSPITTPIIAGANSSPIIKRQKKSTTSSSPIINKINGTTQPTVLAVDDLPSSQDSSPILQSTNLLSLSAITSSSSPMRPSSPYSPETAIVPSYPIHSKNTTGESSYEEFTLKETGQVKRKYSPCSSPISEFSDDANPSSGVPTESSPVPSPKIIQVLSSYNNNNNINNNQQNLSLPTPVKPNNTNNNINPKNRSLLFLLEQEVEKEIITQKELELSAKKLLQQEEQEYVDRIQQVLEYQKTQQNLEYQRLQQKQDELETWKKKLETMEKEIKMKQEIINNQTQILFNSAAINNNNNNIQRQQLHNNNISFLNNINNTQNNNNNNQIKNPTIGFSNFQLPSTNQQKELKYRVPDTNNLKKPIVEVEVNKPTSNQFDINQAKQHLSMSYISYCDIPTIKNWNCSTCKNELSNFTPHKVLYITKTTTQAYVGYTDDTLYVVFRGSKELNNWVSNLKLILVNYSLCKNCVVHAGFLECWNSAKNEIKDTITSALKECTDCTKIVITGHSLGGAISTLCSIEVSKWFPELSVESYTFGSPRVGNDKFAKFFNQNVPNNYRVVYKFDTIPHLPDQLLNYHHVPSEYWFSSKTNYKTCNITGEDPKCSNSVVGLSIKDHTNYFDKPCCCPN